MNRNEIVEQYIINEENLLKYGFQKLDKHYIYQKNINEELYMTFIIGKKQFEVNVYEMIDNEKYLPFYRKEANGSYVSEIKEKVKQEIDFIKNN